MKRLDTPARLQDFLNALPFNFEKEGETIKSPVMLLRKKNAHCLEGALFGAYVLSLHGFTPYVLCLKAATGDFDHVITPFQVNGPKGPWGALSKTNHAVLRYREPVYKNIRELAMSYFHEYFLDSGKKTLRRYSELFNLNTLPKNWMLSDQDLWHIDKALDRIKYYDIVPKAYIKKLRRADSIEIKAGKIVEYPESKA